ncbi:tRNA (adenosine(37)-N6)-threonylcarbamoyltransferase complex dimerization subunit type 1 TsaB [Oleiagrimonas sp. C23AA]|uniref:tRNA (adenosine(37)-N6)-threonylcarbamoyltransferase complex dimerization subunit type 1 TsaB n=1 Tax=Oleiagrimonas sp. C23AA TaxID=2719047 RepID=UPI0014234DD3|nr:tRNA (adenosine(37)-N6)-threonylcarbamoyltransferase complex dimerization subunit type 1 TsaB [Oleiagrimonas sp. C23AA]NII11511.1 tRNA (adenosine(37)-N6)-threonylcarbamoyltransferase complex dimerization subunit type 1 TsaB [Oleiagrimonas sp. C23AA]
MNLLAIETSTESCSVALLCDDTLFERSEVAPRRHAQLALPMADAVLAEAGVARAGIHAIAVGAGPGAFTGVRLGVSMAQGLGFALGCPVYAVSSLQALAMEAPMTPGASILAVIDARMGEVYTASYRVGDGGALRGVDEERVCAPDALDLAPADSWAVVGSGWGTYADTIGAQLPAPPAWAEPECFPQARHVARLAMPRLMAGEPGAPEQALPVYLRNKVALTIDEQRAARAARQGKG